MFEVNNKDTRTTPNFEQENVGRTNFSDPFSGIFYGLMHI